MSRRPSAFRQRAARALEDARLREAVRVTVDGKVAARRRAFASLAELAADGWADGDFTALRDRARATKAHALEHLDELLEQAAAAIKARGGNVWMVSTPVEVGRVVREIAARRGARLVVKSKSMVTEEIHLNEALAAAGIDVVETDLGEFIVQLAGERPAHIVTPAIHKSRAEIAELFSRLVGHPVSTDTPSLAAVARRVLREKFLNAGIGISGANFVVAETGTVVLCTNEGNGRLVTSAPPVHVAVAGIEKIIPSLADLPPFLELLARSGTGQHLTVYTHLVTGPRGPGEPDGPEELHVVFVDNGRTRIRRSPYRDVLACIRCGACLNHCPVYRQVGGHAYGSVYGGPIGVVLAPLLEAGRAEGVEALPAEACSMCAACTEACPVGIPLHDLILRHRAGAAQHGRDESGLGRGLRLTGWLWQRPWGYRLSIRAARLASRTRLRGRDDWLSRLPAPIDGWTQGRDLLPPAPASFGELWRRGEVLLGDVQARQEPSRPPDGARGRGPQREVAAGAEPGRAGVWERPEKRFTRMLRQLGGHVHDVRDAGSLRHVIADICRTVAPAGAAIVLSGMSPVDGPDVLDALQEAGLRAVVWRDGSPDGRAEAARLWRAQVEGAEVGVTVARWAVAETGSVVLFGSPKQARLASLLPRIQVTAVGRADILNTLAELFRRLSGEPLPSSVAVVTGPSRSADIENDLVIGVHGPSEVHVVVVG
ncbi:MAG: LUD domain-containing protein [Bacillota bacterium]